MKRLLIEPIVIPDGFSKKIQIEQPDHSVRSYIVSNANGEFTVQAIKGGGAEKGELPLLQLNARIPLYSSQEGKSQFTFSTLCNRKGEGHILLTNKIMWRVRTLIESKLVVRNTQQLATAIIAAILVAVFLAVFPVDGLFASE